MATRKHIRHAEKNAKKRWRGRGMKNEWNWMIMEEKTDSEGESDE